MMLWVSVVKDGKNIGCILCEGDSINYVVLDGEVPKEYLKDYEDTPKNVFLTKEEFEKYIKMESM